MPIKFRCQHCRQFLGISRERAGDIFDCPTCGRTLRVPELDGSVKPLPRVRLDLGDSQLRKALDEIADIGQSAGDAIEFDGIDDIGRSTSDGSASASGGNSASIPKISKQPEVLSVVPQVAPKPIELAPVAPVVHDIPEPSASTNQRRDQAWKEVVELGEGESSDEPIAQADPDMEAPRGVSRNRPATGTRVLEIGPSFWFAAVGLAASVFTAGFWAGRLTTISSIPVAPLPAKSDEPTGQGSAAPLTKTEAQHSSDAEVAGLRGRVTYRPENGTNRPDKGARVIALPADWNGKAKLQVVGFRSADSADDLRVARASLQAMGGDLAVTSDTGEYELSLKSGGQYLLVVLSGSMPRPEMEDTQASVSQLGAYFDRPQQLLGKVMLHTERITWSGEGSQPWDHVFQR